MPSIWLGIEVRVSTPPGSGGLRREDAAAAAEWIKAFPVRDLVKQRPLSSARSPMSMPSPRCSPSLVWARSKLGTARYRPSANAAFRHSPSFKSSDTALATWLRLGELEAERQDCAEYDERRFRQATREIRSLTREPVRRGIATDRETVQ